MARTRIAPQRTSNSWDLRTFPQQDDLRSQKYDLRKVTLKGLFSLQLRSSHFIPCKMSFPSLRSRRHNNGSKLPRIILRNILILISFFQEDNENESPQKNRRDSPSCCFWGLDAVGCGWPKYHSVQNDCRTTSF